MRYLVEGWRVHLQRSLFNWHNTASFLKLNKNGRGRWQKKKAHYLCGPQSRGGAWPSPVKAPGLGPGDRRFESCRPDYKSRSHCERLFCARARKLTFKRSANEKAECMRSGQRLLWNPSPLQDLEPERSERRKVLPPRLQKPFTQ